jgi:cellulose biosynthesis protein BcsQ
MKVAVISPIKRSGITTSTLLIGYTLAATQGTSVCITYTGKNSDVRLFNGIEDSEDITRSISQVARLLEARAIGPENLPEYCIKLASNIDLMDTDSEAITDEESIDIMSFVYRNIPREFVFCDINTELYEDTTQAILKESDAVILVVTPSFKVIEAAGTYLASDFLPKDKPILLLINMYDTRIAPVAELAKLAGMKMRSTCKIRYNPLIIENCNKGTLDTMIPYIIQKDPRVIELNVDLKECVEFLYASSGILSHRKVKWDK